MPFALPELPFDPRALAPFMSPETLSFHHGKHHRAYLKKVDELVESRGMSPDAGLVELVRSAHERQDKQLFDNAGQAWNHNFLWQCLAAPGKRPQGRLEQLIVSQFGSVEILLGRMVAESVAHFGSGWCWLLEFDGKLALATLHDGDTPVVYENARPMLAVDLWEHAYYVDYRNDRKAYAEAVLNNIIDWDFVARNLDGDGARRGDVRPVAELVAV